MEERMSKFSSTRIPEKIHFITRIISYIADVYAVSAEGGGYCDVNSFINGESSLPHPHEADYS